VTTLATAPDGALYLLGRFDQSIEFDTGTLTSAGGYDMFFAKLYP
jgi:hypothetical protein